MGFKSLAFSIVFFSFSVSAQVIAPSAKEVSFQYSAQFIMTADGGTAEEQADAHSNYMFGVLHSPAVVARYGLDPEWLEGIGGVRRPVTVNVTSVKFDEEGRYVVSYVAYGRLLLHKQVAEKAESSRKISLQLPYDLDRVYLKKCTDPHYFGFGDYWYFWDPYREGCEKLLEPSVTREVVLNLEFLRTRPTEDTPNLAKLRGDNGNGDVFRIYVLNGFNESSDKSKDEGRVNFGEVEEVFASRGYEVEYVDRSPRIPRNRYTKILQKGGKTVRVQVIHQLANTDISADAITFARSFKEAVAEGDMIIYLGHSGLGANLDIDNLNYKLRQNDEGGIEFPQDKYQIFFFDSCSSYSYYLPHFRALKKKGKIDIISYGLSSLFENSANVFGVLVDKFIHLNEAQSWETILRAMEKPLGEQTFLLNVGGV